jgi:hypothetical protein
MLKPPGTKRLKLQYDKLVSDFGFNFKLRRYTLESELGVPFPVKVEAPHIVPRRQMHVEVGAAGQVPPRHQHRDHPCSSS